MRMNVAQKIIALHLLAGEMIRGKEGAISIDQTLTQRQIAVVLAGGTLNYFKHQKK